MASREAVKSTHTDARRAPKVPKVLDIITDTVLAYRPKRKDGKRK